MSDTNTPDYQATLAGWWETAEQGAAKAGDTVIVFNDDAQPGFEVYTIGKDQPMSVSHLRILSRATPPTPAWHDAVAVMAHTEGDDIRRAFVPLYDHATGDDRIGQWADWTEAYDADDLIEPVPLIEARVTDEMIHRARAEYEDATGDMLALWVVRDMLTAALGIGDDK